MCIIQKVPRAIPSWNCFDRKIEEVVWNANIDLAVVLNTAM